MFPVVRHNSYVLIKMYKMMITKNKNILDWVKYCSQNLTEKEEMISIDSLTIGSSTVVNLFAEQIFSEKLININH